MSHSALWHGRNGWMHLTLLITSFIASGCCVPLHTMTYTPSQDVHIEVKEPREARIDVDFVFGHGLLLGSERFRLYEAKGKGIFSLPRKGNYLMSVSHPGYETTQLEIHGRFAPNILLIIPFVSFPWGTVVDYSSGAMHELDVESGQDFFLQRAKSAMRLSQSACDIRRYRLTEVPCHSGKVAHLALASAPLLPWVESVGYLYEGSPMRQPIARRDPVQEAEQETPVLTGSILDVWRGISFTP